MVRTLANQQFGKCTTLDGNCARRSDGAIIQSEMDIGKQEEVGGRRVVAWTLAAMWQKTTSRLRSSGGSGQGEGHSGEWRSQATTSRAKLSGSRMHCARFSKPRLCTVRNGLGTSHLVRVWSQPQPLPNWPSGLSINPHSQLGYGSMVNSQLVWIGWVVTRSPSRSIQTFNYGCCFWSMLIVSYQNRVFNNQGYVFACFAAYNIT